MPTTDRARWRAILRRDRAMDGAFVYSVDSTGIFCRPSCTSRLPRRGNVRFHATPAAAEKEGFRSCLRCVPSTPTVAHRHSGAVATACRRIADAEDAPALEVLAAAAGLSPSHFHRVFKSLTGLTPKAYASAHRSRRVRKELSKRGSVTTAIHAAGFNSSGRFYATSSRTLGMTATAFRDGGEGAVIRFAVGRCSLGSILVAASDRGICSIALGDDSRTLVRELHDLFPNAARVGRDRAFERRVARVVAFVERPALGLDLPLDVRGTAFQERVWRRLAEIPCGETRSYGEIARDLDRPRAARAVATACAANRIAVAIPCHRAVRADGSLAGYRWGIERKATLLSREQPL